MKKLLIALGLGALLMGTTAMAEPGENNGAIVITDEGVGTCWYATWLVDGEPYPDDDNRWVSSDIHIVENKNMIKVICNFDEAPANFQELESAYTERGFRCGVALAYDNLVFRFVTDSKFVVTPSGEARLECSYKVNAK